MIGKRVADAVALLTAEEGTMITFPWFNRPVGLAGAALGVSLMLWSHAAAAAEPSEYQVTEGVAVYLGVVPAEVVKGHAPGHPESMMHGGAPKGQHQYHVVVALFDATSGARISDARVTAQVSGLGLAGSTQKLEPMEIAGTITYGGFFNLPGRDLYTVKVGVTRPGAGGIVAFDFKYDHRR